MLTKPGEFEKAGDALVRFLMESEARGIYREVCDLKAKNIHWQFSIVDYQCRC